MRSRAPWILPATSPRVVLDVARRSLVALVACASLGVVGCQRDHAPDASPSSDDSRAADDVPPAPVVRDDATHLLFSFVDAQGRVQTVPRVDAVPEPVRQRVLVIDLEKTPEQRQAHRFAFFADLSSRNPDGAYTVIAVSRYDAAHKANGPAATPPAEGSVIVYSASWCGFCKKAKAWLRERHVPFVERDVEKTAGAQAELDAKMRSAGVPGGGIPVVDWGGTLVVGFDVASFERLLKEKPPRPPGDDASVPAPAPAPVPAP